ncbi:DUF1259 domain-containing protein [Planococcus sp. ISL-110]|uniref:DUF1259 domain-containing protein n=1 Tax=Planococcus sp. ISL-110 TaxID=2819167 RepID=UPI001BE8E249|nr:DUF1259 domain-containing protein [Planococcus sp. ISL-110]MBT2570839.1 DUF1259 domain-containing protein [Planococcus sp. ISL-110]
MKKMIIADPIKEMTVILEKALDAEVEVTSNLFLVKKIRNLIVKSDNSKFSFKVGCDITFQAMQQSGKTINNAEILLLPSELPVFLSALINHASPLPNNYSQRLVMEPDVYCLYLESRELPEIFAERLAAALKAIDC